MKYRVSFRPQAEADLVALYRYIAKEANPTTAGQYVERIEAACMGFVSFPMRGIARDDIRPGLRILGFERRVAIAFQDRASSVVIARIFYGGRDYERLLRGRTTR